jgi:CMP-2-keto-3-deoxyoctulosonic acid synthetase
VAGDNDLVRVITDDGRIATAVGPQNAIFVHREVANGTERCALALESIPPEYSRVCIVAGDETCVTPANLAALLAASEAGGIWTAVSTYNQPAVTTVELAGDQITRFERSNALPYAALGLYVYPRAELMQYYYQWPLTARERIDGIELLRPFLQGEIVRAVEVDHPGYGLNTDADADLIEAWLSER